MRRILAVILLTTLWGCGSAPAKPFVLPEPLPLSIIVYPQIVQVHSDFRFTCLLPESAEGKVINGIEGIFHEEHNPLDRRSYVRLVTAPCQTMTLYCGYKVPGAIKPIMISRTLEPVGECR
jgi:hypothetical protein